MTSSRRCVESHQSLTRGCTVLYALADLLVLCKQLALMSADLREQNVAVSVAVCEACKS